HEPARKCPISTAYSLLSYDIEPGLTYDTSSLRALVSLLLTSRHAPRGAITPSEGVEEAPRRQCGGRLTRTDPFLRIRNEPTHFGIVHEGAHPPIPHLTPHPLDPPVTPPPLPAPILLPHPAVLAHRLPHLVEPVTGQPTACQYRRTPLRMDRLEQTQRTGQLPGRLASII